MDLSETRRAFLSKGVRISAGLVCGLSLEEQQLLLRTAQREAAKPSSRPGASPFPKGRIGKLELTRLICGGNLISGFAHARDLIYVSDLLRKYFTDEKVLETLFLCQNCGLNAMILRLDAHTVRIIRKFRAAGGRMHWIAQVKLPARDPTEEIRRAIDEGAAAVYIHGGVCDSLVAEGNVQLIARMVEFIKKANIPAGVAGHNLLVHKQCEAAGIDADFYMKTFHPHTYCSARLPQPCDNLWDADPDETRRFMETVQRPWIAYKVLAAGAIHPKQGFRFAYQGGADFICVGMFDWQIEEDVAIARKAIEEAETRPRIWF